ncbi:hypothetical protein MMC25_002390 [Agyrium rufum]|nr:hypothetical protein [Agyrium rufum]
MFRFHKSLDVITHFHAPSLPASVRVATLLKQASAEASETGTIDQAADHSHQNKVQRSEFELNTTEDAPTPDQLKNIFDYLGPSLKSIGGPGAVVEGARDIGDALKKLAEDGKKFRRPIVVDWNNGKAVAGEDRSEILKMIRLPLKDMK